MSQSLSTVSPYGDAGDALDWGLDHMPRHDDIHEFLEAWREGNLEQWPDYLEWVAFQQKCAAESVAMKAKEEAASPVDEVERINQIVEDKLFPIFGAGPYEQLTRDILSAIRNGDEVGRLREALERVVAHSLIYPDFEGSGAHQEAIAALSTQGER